MTADSIFPAKEPESISINPVIVKFGQCLFLATCTWSCSFYWICTKACFTQCGNSVTVHSTSFQSWELSFGELWAISLDAGWSGWLWAKCCRCSSFSRSISSWKVGRSFGWLQQKNRAGNQWGLDTIDTEFTGEWRMNEPQPTTLDDRHPSRVQLFRYFQPLIHEPYCCNDLDE